MSLLFLCFSQNTSHLHFCLSCFLETSKLMFFLSFLSAPNPCAPADGKPLCSHLCLINFNQTFSCACPHLMKLQPDKYTCKGKDRPVVSQQKSAHHPHSFSPYLFKSTVMEDIQTALSHIIHFIKEGERGFVFAGIFSCNCFDCYGEPCC